MKPAVLESLFNYVSGLKAFNFIKNRLQHRRFSVNIGEFLRTTCLIEHLWWLLLLVRKNILKFSFSLLSKIAANFYNKTL